MKHREPDARVWPIWMAVVGGVIVVAYVAVRLYAAWSVGRP